MYVGLYFLERDIIFYSVLYFQYIYYVWEIIGICEMYEERIDKYFFLKCVYYNVSWIQEYFVEIQQVVLILICVYVFQVFIIYLEFILGLGLFAFLKVYLNFYREIFYCYFDFWCCLF